MSAAGLHVAAGIGMAGLDLADYLPGGDHGNDWLEQLIYPTPLRVLVDLHFFHVLFMY